MRMFLSLGFAAIACAAYFGAAEPAAAKNEYCRRSTDFTVSCGFDTLAQCQAMSSGRGGDCYRDPWLGAADDAYAQASVARTHHRK